MSSLFDNIRKHILNKAGDVEESVKNTKWWKNNENGVQEKTQEAMKYLDDLTKDAQFHSAQHPEAIPSIAKDGKIIGYFDSPHSTYHEGKGYGWNRKIVGDENFGYGDTPVKGDTREKYGFVTNAMTPIEDEDLADGFGYGEYIFDFNPNKMKGNTTMTTGDSMMFYDDGVSPIIAGDKNSYWNTFKGDRAEPLTREGFEGALGRKPSPYMEFQYHGPLSLDNAIGLYAPRKGLLRGDIKRGLDKISDDYKIPLYDMNGCYKNCEDFDPSKLLINPEHRSKK